MQRAGLVLGLVVIGCAMNGCGGSSSASIGGASAGNPLDEYSGTLPDGSKMEIEILADGSGDWGGEFAVAAETGPYAFQTGTFFGSADGGNLSGTCQCTDGTQFTISGKVLSDGTLQLTRSDIPGTQLTFTKVAIPAAASRADVSFTLNARSSSTATVSTTPVSSTSTMVGYRGTWRGLNITAWMYSHGTAALLVYAHDHCVGQYYFASLKLEDLGIKTATSSTNSGGMSVWDPKTDQVTNYGGTLTVSP